MTLENSLKILSPKMRKKKMRDSNLWIKVDLRLTASTTYVIVIIRYIGPCIEHSFVYAVSFIYSVTLPLTSYLETWQSTVRWTLNCLCFSFSELYLFCTASHVKGVESKYHDDY